MRDILWTANGRLAADIRAAQGDVCVLRDRAAAPGFERGKQVAERLAMAAAALYDAQRLMQEIAEQDEAAA